MNGLEISSGEIKGVSGGTWRESRVAKSKDNPELFKGKESPEWLREGESGVY
jgi:hypothetical protein